MIDTQNLKTLLEHNGIVVSAKAIDDLDRFAYLLSEKNKVLNLTAIKEPEEIAIKHLLDSLMIFHYVSIPKASKVIDVGCGAGFPSVPMLIARNDLHMTFLDATGKKLAFVEESVHELGLTGTFMHARAEEAAKKDVSRETFDFAVARAVANMRSLSELTLPFVKPGGYFIAMKGKEGETELEQAGAAIAALGGQTRAVHAFTLPDGSARTLLVIKKISQTSPKYPRTATAILKKPL